MRRFTSMKVGLVVALSCLMLMLGLFSSMGVASAHSAQAVRSQTSVSTLTGDGWRCKRILVLRGWGGGGWGGNGWGGDGWGGDGSGGGGWGGDGSGGGGWGGDGSGGGGWGGGGWGGDGWGGGWQPQYYKLVCRRVHWSWN